jgi:hypothetical protein
MKNLKYILVLALVIVLGVVAARNWKSEEEFANSNFFGNSSESDDTDDAAAPAQEFCYVWNTEAGDNASLRLMTSDGINVTGSFNYIPAQKDSKKGTVKGTVGEVDEVAMTQTADLVWTAMGEGMTNAEQLYVVLGANTANPGFGEMTFDLAKAMYVYANPAKISYEPTLQRTECTDPALR